MAEYALFIGWGPSRVGREAAAARLFAESIAYWNRLKDAGEIESIETVILSPHGGDLTGFALLRGAPDKLARISMAPETQALTMRVQLCRDGVGVVPAVVDEGVARAMQAWTQAVSEMA